MFIVSCAVDALAPYGFHSYNDLESKESKGYKDYMNQQNFEGYIPIFGTFAGLDRIRTHSNMLKQEDLTTSTKIVCYSHIVRGIIELTSCGILLLIPDLITTLIRKVAHYIVMSNQFNHN